MPFYKVKPGQVLAHGGEELAAGQIVELPRAVGEEISHLVSEVDAAGLPILKSLSALERELEKVRPHERISLLQAERALVVERLAELDAAIAKEQPPVGPVKHRKVEAPATEPA